MAAGEGSGEREGGGGAGLGRIREFRFGFGRSGPWGNRPSNPRPSHVFTQDREHMS
jgi:hypothetical protein